MRSVVEIGATVPAFLGKLWKLVNDSETNHMISWSPVSILIVLYYYKIKHFYVFDQRTNFTNGITDSDY